MKLIKNFFALISFLLLSFLLVGFFKELDQQFLYHTDQILTISTWDQKSNKKTIFKGLDQETKKQKINLYKSTSSVDQSNTIKYIYPFIGDKKLKNDFHNFDISKKNRIISFSQLQKRDIRGEYFVRGEVNKQKFLKILKKLGLSGNFINVNFPRFFSSYMCQEGILLSIFALLLISFLIFLHERSANFKAYAIKRLHGYSIFKIFIDDLKKSTIYFLLLPSCAAIVTFLFLLISPYHGQLLFFLKWLIIAYSVLTILLLMLNLLSYASLSLIDVSQMVKGKRPYKILRSIALGSKFAMILIVFLLLIQNVASLSDLKKIQKHNEIWRKVDNYYSLYFAPFITGNKEYGDVAEKFNRLFAEEEKYGAILIKNNNASNPKKDNFEPTNGNVLIVNNNFVSLYRKFDKNIFAGKRINQQKTINLFLPTKAQRKKTAIEKNFIDLFQFEKGDPNQSAAVSFSAKNMNKDYYIFAFNSRASIDQPYADSPLIALIQNQSVQRYFYYAAATNGGIIFKDYQHLRNSLDKYGLSHYISGITSFKDDVADQISSLDKEIFLLTITIILVIFVLVLSIIMDIGEYFQQNKKLILIRKLHGYSLIKQHGTHLSLSLGSSGLMFALLISTPVWQLSTFNCSYFFNRRISGFSG
ncbi:DUF1430 domain-containing protein [Oenococcus oeni]|uniref:Bacteriocin-associated integral membrane protein n=18 Tax=Oenococcus oeni TaxID=1247 RepID=D3L7C6_OENOE|nr:DUF1430 domain-containing protein [Oenococcus oeni]AWW98542.1 DUF1430 domain-containing protein [Oenococcus oeni]EFD89238.1 hypothetical protein AWRIB429_0256 [Oenococcus oeni AWRIB429]EJN92942.1 putative bacteriocin immunity protein [Oenococcus oeni AWRIB304]EJN99563.1 putative bacteriocin immunity protein [Oenococcus oeni AWRIB318]EJO08764.1 putative bacteriocin immunity protein [Oenococcus oeni AWRIB568]